MLGCKMRVDELRRESLVMRRFPPPFTVGEETQPIEDESESGR